MIERCPDGLTRCLRLHTELSVIFSGTLAGGSLSLRGLEMAPRTGYCQSRPRTRPSARLQLLQVQMITVGAAWLCLLSLCMAAANDGSTPAAAERYRLPATDLSGAMIPSYDSMASLQQALSHSSWLDDAEALGVGRSLLRRRKKRSDDDEEEEEEDSDDDDSSNDEDDEEDDDDMDRDGNKKKKKKNKRVKSKTTKLLGVQLDMTMLTAEADDSDDNDDDKDEDDDRRRQRRHLLAAAAAASKKPSTEMMGYVQKSPLFPNGFVVVIGTLPRSEAETGCGNAAGGTVEFSIDLKKMIQVDGVDDGDDVSKLKVVHHLNCMVPDAKDKSKMVVNPDIKTKHFFVVVVVKTVAAAVDCSAGAADCIVYGPAKTFLSPKALAQVAAAAAGTSRRRKLQAESLTKKEFKKAVTTPSDTASVYGDTSKLPKAFKQERGVAPRSGDPGEADREYQAERDVLLKDVQNMIKKEGKTTSLTEAQTTTGSLSRTHGDTKFVEQTATYAGKHPDSGRKFDAKVTMSTNANDPSQVSIKYHVRWPKMNGQPSEEFIVTQEMGDAPPESQCFPAAARVLLSNGTQAAMWQLRHGDRVLTVLPGGQLGFSEVYLFGHKDPDAHANYVALQTEINTTLLATSDHYIHIIPHSKAAAGMPLSWKDTVHTRAGKVQPGDVMVHVSWDNCATPSDIASHKDSSCGSMQYVTITSAKMQVAKGLYNPYTMVGNIVVDGHSASSHSGLDFLDPLTGTGPYVPYLHQAMLAPLRLIQRLYPSLMAHVDQQYSRDAWSSAGVANVIGSIVQYHLKGA